MKTKTLKIITLVMSVVLVMSMLTGCFPLIKDYKEYADGYFKYIVDEVYSDHQGKFVAIIGFTDLGLEQEVIDIPREIDGKPVRYIGYRKATTFMDSYYDVECSFNLKKIYVYENIRCIENLEGKNVSLMLCSVNEDLSTNQSKFKNIYSYGSMVDRVNEHYLNKHASSANTVFMNNYSDEINEGYYRLDNIEYGETIQMPPEPVRSGFEFTGWYTETECINLWDFDMSPTIEEDTEFRLYAGWRKK